MLMTTTSLRDQRSAPSDRIDYLDAAKGIFIIFIITGHHLLGAESFRRHMYTLGVTPFFLISGFLYAFKREWEQPFGKTSIRKIQKLLYPFLTFSIINLLWNVWYYKIAFPSAVPEYSIRKMLLYTVSTYGYNALWYLPCVLWGTLLFFALRRVKHHDLIWAVSAICIIVFYVLFDKKLTGLGFVSYVYCYLFRVLVSVVYLYAGSVLFFVFKNMNTAQEKLLLLISSVVAVIIGVLYHLYPEHFPIANLAAHRLGNPYVYYLASISNTTVILLVCKKFLGRSRVLSYFGRNSLILMALHMDVTIRIAWWLFPKLPIDFGETINSLIVIGMELLMFVVIIPIINRCFPFILTPKKAAKNR